MLNKMHQGSHLGLGSLISGRHEVRSEKVGQERKEQVVPQPPSLPRRGLGLKTHNEQSLFSRALSKTHHGEDSGHGGHGGIRCRARYSVSQGFPCAGPGNPGT